MTTTPDEPPTALVLAAARRPDDPIARAAGVDHKALVPVAGVPMLQRVVEALRASGCVGRIVVSIDRAAVLAACPA
ncbi:MAG: NTP transferase domain-containing protein, partial [Alphaproteobacteria bacterium]